MTLRADKGSRLTHAELDGNFIELDHRCYRATTAPTANDDITKGFVVGDEWKNTSDFKTYELKDNTAGSAVWEIKQASGFDENGNFYDKENLHPDDTSPQDSQYSIFLNDGTRQKISNWMVIATGEGNYCSGGNTYITGSSNINTGYNCIIKGSNNKCFVDASVSIGSFNYIGDNNFNIAVGRKLYTHQEGSRAFSGWGNTKEYFFSKSLTPSGSYSLDFYNIITSHPDFKDVVNSLTPIKSIAFIELDILASANSTTFANTEIQKNKVKLKAILENRTVSIIVLSDVVEYSDFSSNETFTFSVGTETIVQEDDRAEYYYADTSDPTHIFFTTYQPLKIAGTTALTDLKLAITGKIIEHRYN